MFGLNFYEEKIKCNAVKCCGNCVELKIENDGYIHCEYYGVSIGLFDTCDKHSMFNRGDSLIEEIIEKNK